MLCGPHAGHRDNNPAWARLPTSVTATLRVYSTRPK
jgi:hypothetical protein